MSNQAYHNKGFGVAFTWIIVLTMILPLIGLMFIDDTWDRVVNKYVSAWTSECWQNSKHERVCRGDNNCKFGRNFCIDEVYRWRVKCCLLYTSPSPRDRQKSRMPSSA